MLPVCAFMCACTLLTGEGVFGRRACVGVSLFYSVFVDRCVCAVPAVCSAGGVGSASSPTVGHSLAYPSTQARSRTDVGLATTRAGDPLSRSGVDDGRVVTTPYGRSHASPARSLRSVNRPTFAAPQVSERNLGTVPVLFT